MTILHDARTPKQLAELATSDPDIFADFLGELADHLAADDEMVDSREYWLVAFAYDWLVAPQNMANVDGDIYRETFAAWREQGRNQATRQEAQTDHEIALLMQFALTQPSLMAGIFADEIRAGADEEDPDTLELLAMLRDRCDAMALQRDIDAFLDAA